MRRFYRVAGLIFGLMLAAASPVFAESERLPATEVNKAVNTVERLHGQLVDLMLSGETDLAARKAMIKSTLTTSFDLPAMTRAIVGGRLWRDLDEPKQADAIAAFSDWMVTQYASRFSTSTDPEFLTRETRDGGLKTVVVKTQLRTKKRVVGLDYRIRENGEGFKIIDVFLDGRVSEVALRKSEFRKTIKDGGVDGFIFAVTTKTAALTAG